MNIHLPTKKGARVTNAESASATTCGPSAWVVDNYSSIRMCGLTSVLKRLIRCSGLVVLFVAALGGCASTMEPVGDDQEIRVQLTVGDTVRVLTKDSQRRVFKIVSLESDAMVGDDIRIPYADIVFLERRKSSPGRTAVGVTAAALITIMLVITVNGAVGFPPGM